MVLSALFAGGEEHLLSDGVQRQMLDESDPLRDSNLFLLVQLRGRSRVVRGRKVQTLRLRTRLARLRCRLLLRTQYIRLRYYYSYNPVSIHYEVKEKGRNKKYRRDVDATSEEKAHRELFNKSVTIDDAQNLLYISPTE